MSKKAKSVTEGDDAWTAIGQRMSTAEVERLNQLREASKVRAISSSEDNELFNLAQRNRTRTRVE